MQIWGGACVMEEMIAEDPGAVGLTAQVGGAPLRLFEFGAGMGLVTRVLAALASRAAAPVEIIMTDLYPSVLANLARAAEHARKLPLCTLSHIITANNHGCAPWLGRAHRYAACAAPTHAAGALHYRFGAYIVYEAPHSVRLRDDLATVLRRAADPV